MITSTGTSQKCKQYLCEYAQNYNYQEIKTKKNKKIQKLCLWCFHTINDTSYFKVQVDHLHTGAVGMGDWWNGWRAQWMDGKQC